LDVIRTLLRNAEAKAFIHTLTHTHTHTNTHTQTHKHTHTHTHTRVPFNVEVFGSGTQIAARDAVEQVAPACEEEDTCISCVI